MLNSSVGSLLLLYYLHARWANAYGKTQQRKTIKHSCYVCVPLFQSLSPSHTLCIYLSLFLYLLLSIYFPLRFQILGCHCTLSRRKPKTTSLTVITSLIMFKDFQLIVILDDPTAAAVNLPQDKSLTNS